MVFYAERVGSQGFKKERFIPTESAQVEVTVEAIDHVSRERVPDDHVSTSDLTPERTKATLRHVGWLRVYVWTRIRQRENGD